MIELKRTSSDDSDFNFLIGLLDEDLWRRYPKTQQNYTAHNIIKLNAKAVVAYDDEKPVGCGCFRETGDDTIVEIKRMYVLDAMRGKGIAKRMLRDLETWASELGADKAILETGIGQPEAISLYEKSGYCRIDNYGPYANNPDSICMAKGLSKS